MNRGNQVLIDAMKAAGRAIRAAQVELVRDFEAKEGRKPTHEELMERTQCSRSTAFRMLQRARRAEKAAVDA